MNNIEFHSLLQRKEALIKVLLAIMMFLALAKMPYGYFELLRFVAFACFGFLSYTRFKQDKVQSAMLYLFLGILFQPFLKISLGRELWNFVDVIVGVGLLVSVFKNFKNEIHPD